MRGHQGERVPARHSLATAHQSDSFHSFSAVYVPHSQHMLPLHICCNAAYLTGGHTEVKSQTITSRQSLRTYHLSEAALCVCFLNVHASLYAVQIGCTALFIKKNNNVVIFDRHNEKELHGIHLNVCLMKYSPSWGSNFPPMMRLDTIFTFKSWHRATFASILMSSVMWDTTNTPMLPSNLSAGGFPSLK